MVACSSRSLISNNLIIFNTNIWDEKRTLRCTIYVDLTSYLFWTCAVDGNHTLPETKQAYINEK